MGVDEYEFFVKWFWGFFLGLWKRSDGRFLCWGLFLFWVCLIVLVECYVIFIYLVVCYRSFVDSGKMFLRFVGEVSMEIDFLTIINFVIINIILSSGFRSERYVFGSCIFIFKIIFKWFILGFTFVNGF